MKTQKKQDNKKKIVKDSIIMHELQTLCMMFGVAKVVDLGCAVIRETCV